MTPSQTVRLNQPANVKVAYVVQYPDRPDIGTMPQSTTERVTHELGRRNLSAQIVPYNTFGKSFETRRTTAQRLSDLGAQNTYVMLIESEVRFYSFLSGKYRWNIAGRVTLVAPNGEEVTQPLELAAFLDFDHQKEEEAIRYAEVAIAERAGQVADRLLAGSTDGSVTLPAR
jgi:hypothetical protein